MYFVYILKSRKNNEFYKGFTNSLNRRILEHMSGESFSTKSMLPLDLVHVEICSNRTEARTFEKYLKSGIGRKIIKELFT